VNFAQERANTEVFHPYADDELQARLAIYRNNYFASLIDVLKDTFPTILKLVGNDFFSMLCKEYIKNEPPNSPILIDYGYSLPHFIEGFSALSNFPYMADVAQLDYLRHQAYYTEDATTLTSADYAHFDVASLGAALIYLHPSVSLFSSNYAAFSIWDNNQTGSKEEVNANKSEAVLIYRHAEEIITSKLETGLFTFLYNLQQQRSFSQSLEAAFDADAEFNPAEAVNYLISSGLSTKVVCKEHNTGEHTK
jgi:hypothetical protein